jgi:diadenosine tetraphosphate (Ap4A) HIT family hydrolase
MQDRGTDRRKYLQDWATLNRELASIEQCDFPHPQQAQRFLSAQYNPARVHRLKLRGDALFPGRNDVVNDGCLLCSGNIEWQHRGIEMGYAIEINGTAFNILMNAYPLMPRHIVVASADHTPQAWELGEARQNQFSIEKLVTNLASTARRLPGYVGFYNGDGAGASVPAHFHYQFFKRRNGGDRFPLELAPLRQIADLVAEVEDYPVTAMRWHGDKWLEVVARASTWINNWLSINLDQRPGLSANIFAMTDVASEQLQLYFVPRDRKRDFAHHLSSTIGSLEILGELVLTRDSEKRDLDWGKIDYQFIARILADISVPL